VSVVPEKRQRDAALRAAAEAVAETLPDDWRTAEFVIEIERGPDGDLQVQVAAYSVSGDSFEQAGGVCG
jgi:hypothetical protein